MSIPVSFTGRMTRDPELRFTAAGKAVAGFSLATNKRTFNQQSGKWEDGGDPSFWNCSAFGDLAENICEELIKGQLVFISGNMQMRKYQDKDGNDHTVYEVLADHVGPSLKWKDKDSRPKAAASSSYDSAPPF